MAMELRAVDGVRIADKTVLKMMNEMGLRCGIRRVHSVKSESTE